MPGLLSVGLPWCCWIGYNTTNKKGLKMNHNLTEEQIEVIRPYFHGLTDEQFQEEINKFPLNNISEAMNDYIISFLDKAVDSKKVLQ